MSTKAAPRTRDSRGFSHSHGSRLSIDPDHHVTEAIGDMYGDYADESGHRYSYISGVPVSEQQQQQYNNGQPQSGSGSGLRTPNRLSTASLSVPGRFGGPGSPIKGGQTPPQSPTLSLRPGSPSLGSLTDIDYESNPVAVAQEISNLQALRRMSMDVTSAADPDLPSFNNFVPPTPPDDGGDPSSVFWVPARLHPELAPQEFSAFLESKKNEIRRPSRDGSLSPDSGNASPGLRRKKSMLSRQIDAEAAKSYQDGADRLEKRKSQHGPTTPTVQLDDLISDPSALIEKLNVNSQQQVEAGDQKDDMPILPAPPKGLKRSTNTQYRKSLRRGGGGGSRWHAAIEKTAETGRGKQDAQSPMPEVPKGGFKLDQIASKVASLPPQEKDTLSAGRQKQPSASIPATSFDELIPKATTDSQQRETGHERPKSVPTKTQRPSSPKSSARSRTSEPTPPVPVIVETPPPQSIPENPERNASFDSSGASLKKRSQPLREEPSASPEPRERKDKKRPDSGGGSISSRKTSWSWLPGHSAEREREKEERKEREREEKARAKKEKEREKEKSRPKSEEKRPKSSEKYDNTRLDVLQKSIEMGNTGRVVGAEPPPSKEESRKSRGEDRKDSIFSFFGGSRKKSGDNTEKKKGSSRGTSPDPAQEKKQPDFYYTRFPIHIERAIYRLSHLKLANPRRPLHQQVLLSNFMYSYLAKVQQTQPHLIQQATVSPSQQERIRQQQQQQQLTQQQQQQQQHYQQHQQQMDPSGQYYYDDNVQDQQSDYVDDSQMYEYEDDRPQSRQAQYAHENGNGYYHQQDHGGGGGSGGGGGGGGDGGVGGGSDFYRGRSREKDDMW